MKIVNIILGLSLFLVISVSAKNKQEVILKMEKNALKADLSLA